MRAFAVVVFFLLLLPPVVSAQTGTAGSVRIQARAGELLLSASGVASPRGEVVLYIGTDRIQGAITDEKSGFAFRHILINRGLTNFCLESHDNPRTGSSYACFSFPPAQDRITYTDVYLPPTIGLGRSEVTEGEEAVVVGYSIPGSGVEIRSDKGLSVKAVTDHTGRYEQKIGGLKVGEHHFFAYGYTGGRKSEMPMKSITLKVISRTEATKNEFKNISRSPLKLTLLIVSSLLLAAGVFAAVRWRVRIRMFINRTIAVKLFKLDLRMKEWWG